MRNRSKERRALARDPQAAVLHQQILLEKKKKKMAKFPGFLGWLLPASWSERLQLFDPWIMC
jgi:hypothetical protein